jgi:hypothetical protein
MVHSKDAALSLGPGIQPPAISSRTASSIAVRIAPQENGAGATVIQQHPRVVHGETWWSYGGGWNSRAMRSNDDGKFK